MLQEIQRRLSTRLGADGAPTAAPQGTSPQQSKRKRGVRSKAGAGTSPSEDCHGGIVLAIEQLLTSEKRQTAAVATAHDEAAAFRREVRRGAAPRDGDRNAGHAC